MKYPKSYQFIVPLAIFGLLLSTTHAQTVYENDFSSAPTVQDIGGNNSPWVNANLNGVDGNFFDSSFSQISATSGTLDFTSGTGTAWLYLDTSSWAEGDYSVSFDGLVPSGNTMAWDVIGGNNPGAGTGTGNILRIRMNFSNPFFRATNAGGTAERLGQINAQGDTAGTATEQVAAGSFTDTAFTSQELTITLTAANSGSANDYIMIGWSNSGGNGTASIDNLTISTIPEPSSFALFTSLALVVVTLAKRRSFAPVSLK